MGESIKRGVSHPNTTCINREAREHGRRNWGDTNLNVKYPFSAYMGPFLHVGVSLSTCAPTFECFLHHCQKGSFLMSLPTNKKV